MLIVCIPVFIVEFLTLTKVGVTTNYSPTDENGVSVTLDPFQLDYKGENKSQRHTKSIIVVER